MNYEQFRQDNEHLNQGPYSQQMAQMGVGAPPGTIRRNKEPHHDQLRDNSISIKLPSRQRNREHYLHNSDAMNLQSDPINKSLIKNKPKLIKNVDF